MTPRVAAGPAVAVFPFLTLKAQDVPGGWIRALGPGTGIDCVRVHCSVAHLPALPAPTSARGVAHLDRYWNSRA